MAQRTLPIPVSFRIFVQRGKHDRQYDLDIVTDEITEVLVIPEIKSSFSDLENHVTKSFHKRVEKHTWK